MALGQCTEGELRAPRCCDRVVSRRGGATLAHAPSSLPGGFGMPSPTRARRWTPTVFSIERVLSEEPSKPFHTLCRSADGVLMHVPDSALRLAVSDVSGVSEGAVLFCDACTRLTADAKLLAELRPGSLRVLSAGRIAALPPRRLPHPAASDDRDELRLPAKCAQRLYRARLRRLRRLARGGLSASAGELVEEVEQAFRLGMAAHVLVQARGAARANARG